MFNLTTIQLPYNLAADIESFSTELSPDFVENNGNRKWALNF